MATPLQLRPGSARDLRRHRALVAHLSACGEFNIDRIDRSHPVVANATLAELDAAILDAARLLQPPLHGKVERWMAGQQELPLGLAEQWLPLHEARHLHLQWVHAGDRRGVVHSPIEVWIVVGRKDVSRAILYHVIPVSSPEASAYVLIRPGQTPMRLDPPNDSFITTRALHSTISSSMMADALNAPATSFSPLPEWEAPLHAFIHNALA